MRVRVFSHNQTDEAHMEGFGGGLAAPAAAARGGKGWSAAVADEVVARTLAGETMRGICRDPAMPALRTVKQWMQRRPPFARAIGEARVATGRRFSGSDGGMTRYCAETAEAIFERLCAGEAMVKICEDPDLPVSSCVYRWMRTHDEFREAVEEAREIAADRLAAEGWELAQAATPATARLAEVQLRQLRWHAGKIAPRKYGSFRATEPPAAPEPPVVTIIKARSFRVETRADGCRRVRGSYADPETVRLIEEEPGPCNAAPP